jgi:outer membrane biosynthesis protein TonB
MRKTIIRVVTFIFTLFIGFAALWVLHIFSSSSAQSVVSSPTDTSEISPKPKSNNLEKDSTVGESIEISPCPDTNSRKHILNYQMRSVALGVVNSKAICRNLPDYPTSLKNKNISGIVKVWVSINQEGEVVGVWSEMGHKLLRQSAEKAASQTRFPPLRLGGEAVRGVGVMIYQVDSERGVFLINPLSPQNPFKKVDR